MTHLMFSEHLDWKTWKTTLVEGGDGDGSYFKHFQTKRPIFREIEEERCIMRIFTTNNRLWAKILGEEVGLTS